jgi:hypothetical protein
MLLKKLNDLAETNKGLQFFKILVRPVYILGLRFLKYLRKPYDRIIQKILISKTPIASCVLHGRPEVHSLVCHRHMYNYILAIKSLLRFYNDVTVIVHDDGSLTKKDKRTIKKHVENINIIDRDYADEKIDKIFYHYPNCRRYRDECVNALQLFDYMLLSESDKIVSLDSDILFFKKPETLIDWLRDGTEIIHFWEQEPAGTREFLAKINLDDCFVPVNIGLLCFYKETMNLDLLEQILSKVEIFDWCTGQQIYSILLKKQIERHELSFFEPSQYQDQTEFRDGGDEQIARHYWSSVGTLDEYLPDRKKIIKELLNASKVDKI